MSFDYSEFVEFYERTVKFEAGVEQFITNLLLEVGKETYELTKKLTPIDTRETIDAWELSDVTRDGEYLVITISNPLEHASHLEDGHQQHRRFLPGAVASNGKFRYIKGHKTGIMLTNRWIPGRHMARVAITTIQFRLPSRYQTAFDQYLSQMGMQ